MKGKTIDAITERKAMKNDLVTDEKIIELFFNRDESALEHVSRKYQRLYLSVLREVLENESDVAECANDLLLSLWNSIPPTRPTHLAAYIVKLARHIGISRFRYNTRQKRNGGYTLILSELEDVLSDTPSNDEDVGEISDLLSEFVATLDTATRVLFLRRYVYMESIPSLAKRFNMTENNVSVKLHRARAKLKKHLGKEGISI